MMNVSENGLFQIFSPLKVPYKTISEIANISRGQVMSKDFLRDNSGEYPVYSSQTENEGMLGKITTYMFNGEYLTWTTDGANAGTVFYRNGKFSVTNVCGVINVTDKQVLTKYLFYALNREAPQHVNKGMGNSKLMSNVIGKIRIPLPPLPVQQEIVRILDSFTQLTAELTARRKQYEHYRDELLTFGDDVPHLPLGNVILSLNTGLNPRQFFKLNTDDAQNYYVTIRELQNNRIVVSEKTDRINDEARLLCNGRSNLEINDILFSGTGTIGETAIITEKPYNWNIKKGVYAIKPDSQKVNSKYLMYLLRSTAIRTSILKKAAGGTVKSVPMAEMKKIVIPVPLIKKQMSIVSLLDRFDALCNDLTSGLPAEIEARQKQYEYYRDKLLNFEEIRNS